MYTSETAKTYEGHITVLAWPMTRGEYSAYRGWTLPENEAPADAGYLVELTDGNAPQNHPSHDKYVSWLLSEVFEAAYTETAPSTWQSRLKAEYEDLWSRTGKLEAFQHTPEYAALDLHERSLLDQQHSTMVMLSAVLRQRLRRLALQEAGPEPLPHELEKAADDPANQPVATQEQPVATQEQPPEA